MEFKPYQIIRTYYGEMEIISYPFPVFEGKLNTINIYVRLAAGDPTTMRRVLVADLEGLIRAVGIEVK